MEQVGRRVTDRLQNYLGVEKMFFCNRQDFTFEVLYMYRRNLYYLNFQLL